MQLSQGISSRGLTVDHGFPSQRCVECSIQFPGASTTRRCARVALQEVHHDGRRKDLGLRDLVESDGGIVSAAEFERSFGMSGRSEDVLDLSSFRQGVEERRTHRVAGRARSVARRSLSRIAGPPEPPGGSPPLSRSALVRSPPSANACATSIAAHGRRSSGRSRSKIANAGRAHHRVAGDLRSSDRVSSIVVESSAMASSFCTRADVSTRRPLAGPLAAQARSRRVAPDVPLIRRQMNAGQLPAARLVPRAAGARGRSTRLKPSRLHMAGSCHPSAKVQWKSDRGRRLRAARSATPCRFRTRQTCSDGKRLAHSAATVP